MRFKGSWILLWVLGVASLSLGATPSWAKNYLKKIDVHGEEEVQLILDAPISKSQMTVDYLNDIVQVSLRDVTIYPAKMSAVNGNILSKVFAYQFSPHVVRCRFTLKGKVEDWKDQTQVELKGRSIFFKIQAKAAASKNNRGNHHEEENFDEAQLMEKVMKANAPATPEQKPVAPAPTVAQKIDTAASQPAASMSVATPTSGPAVINSKPLPSLRMAAIKFGGVLLLVGLFAFGLKKLKNLEHRSSNGIFGALSRFARGGLNSQEKMIRVLASHHLDPKKSISVVQIGNRQFVLGVSSDSIQLLTELTDAANLDEDLDLEDGEESAAPRTFANVISEASEAEKFKSSVRSRIRSRLEGLKPL